MLGETRFLSLASRLSTLAITLVLLSGLFPHGASAALTLDAIANNRQLMTEWTGRTVMDGGRRQKMVLYDGYLYVTTFQEPDANPSKLYRVDTTTGTKTVIFEAEDFIGCLAVYGTDLYFAHWSGVTSVTTLYRYDGATIQVVPSLPAGLADYSVSSMIVHDGYLWICTESGGGVRAARVYRYSPQSGFVDTGAPSHDRCTSITAWNGALYLLADDGYGYSADVYRLTDTQSFDWTQMEHWAVFGEGQIIGADTGCLFVHFVTSADGPSRQVYRSADGDLFDLIHSNSQDSKQARDPVAVGDQVFLFGSDWLASLSGSDALLATCATQSSLDVGFSLDEIVVGDTAAYVLGYDLGTYINPKLWRVDLAGGPPPPGAVAGTVLDDGQPLVGVSIDIVDAAGESHYTVTDALGQYLVENVAVGTADLSIAVPLGYILLSPEESVVPVPVLPGQETVQDFLLEAIVVTEHPRNRGWWAHQVNVHCHGRDHDEPGHDDDDDEDPEETSESIGVTYAELIFNHFFSNQLNSIEVENVTFMAAADTVPLDVCTMVQTLKGKGEHHGDPIEKERLKLKGEYLALLLNLAANRLHGSTIVTADSATASQMVQLVADGIRDPAATRETLKDLRRICKKINHGKTVEAGTGATNYQQIAYARPIARLRGVSPNPFFRSTVLSYEVVTAGETSIKVYDVQGRMVRTLVNRWQEPGHYQVKWDRRGYSGDKVASGLYFASGSGSKVMKLVVLK